MRNYSNEHAAMHTHNHKGKRNKALKIRTCINGNTHIHTYKHKYVRTYIHMCMYVCAQIYVHMSACAYMHIHTSAQERNASGSRMACPASLVVRTWPETVPARADSKRILSIGPSFNASTLAVALSFLSLLQDAAS